jgi:hypothetical protein
MKPKGAKISPGGHEPDRRDHRPGRQRLRDEARRPGSDRLLGERARGGAREDRDGPAGIRGDHPREPVEPVHAGHVVVEEHEVERALPLHGDEGTVKRAGRRDRLGAFGGEERRDRVPDEVMVVSNENLHRYTWQNRRGKG